MEIAPKHQQWDANYFAIKAERAKESHMVDLQPLWDDFVEYYKASTDTASIKGAYQRSAERLFELAFDDISLEAYIKKYASVDDITSASIMHIREQLNESSLALSKWVQERYEAAEQNQEAESDGQNAKEKDEDVGISPDREDSLYLRDAIASKIMTKLRAYEASNQLVEKAEAKLAEKMQEKDFKKKEKKKFLRKTRLTEPVVKTLRHTISNLHDFTRTIYVPMVSRAIARKFDISNTDAHYDDIESIVDSAFTTILNRSYLKHNPELSTFATFQEGGLSRVINGTSVNFLYVKAIKDYAKFSEREHQDKEGRYRGNLSLDSLGAKEHEDEPTYQLTDVDAIDPSHVAEHNDSIDAMRGQLPDLLVELERFPKLHQSITKYLESGGEKQDKKFEEAKRMLTRIADRKARKSGNDAGTKR